jgi:hypothetical protein
MPTAIFCSKALKITAPRVADRSSSAPAGSEDVPSRAASECDGGAGAPGSEPDMLVDLVKRAQADAGVVFEPATLRGLAALRVELDRAATAVAGERGDCETTGSTQAATLVRLVTEAGADLFRDAAGEEFVTVTVDGHRQTWPVHGKETESWLARLYVDQSGGEVPNAEALRVAIKLLVGRALFEGREEPVGLRVAEYDGRLYLDLCDRDWRAVEIGPDGWRVVANPPIRFRRARGMLPLPAPERGGSIDSLRRFVNVRPKAGEREDSCFVLAVAWLLAALRPRGPYPVLALAGEQGTAKSSFARVLRRLVDPNYADLRSPPRDNRDLFIAARNSHAIVFDNMSEIRGSLSDSLCRLATGGSFATRRLRTDSEEVLFEAMRPIIVNGIEDCITRPDLAERSIFVTLDEIPEHRRQEEHALWKAFEAERPRLLGALLDAAAHGLRTLPKVELARRPRMADFARWVTACEGALWEPGTFIAAYDDNREAAVEAELAADAVASSVRALMATRPRWEGTATDLLAALAAAKPDVRRGDKKWPANVGALLGRLRRVTPGLRRIGIRVEATHLRGLGTITIAHVAHLQLNPTADSTAACRVQACQGKIDHGCCQADVDSGLPQRLITPVEKGTGGLAIKVKFPGGARVSIPASSRAELATAVVKALSQC